MEMNDMTEPCTEYPVADLFRGAKRTLEWMAEHKAKLEARVTSGRSSIVPNHMLLDDIALIAERAGELKLLISRYEASM